MSEYYQIFIKKKPRQELFKAVLVDEYLFDRHVKEISYIHCKFKRWSASAVLNGADRLSRYPKLFYQITLPYLFLFSYLCKIVFHKSPRRTLVHIYITIVTAEVLCVKYSLRLWYSCVKKKTCRICDRSPWCSGPESNQGHGDFQSPALPTELPEHNGGPSWGRTKDRPVMSRLL